MLEMEQPAARDLLQCFSIILLAFAERGGGGWQRLARRRLVERGRRAYWLKRCKRTGIGYFSIQVSQWTTNTPKITSSCNSPLISRPASREDSNPAFCIIMDLGSRWL